MRRGSFDLNNSNPLTVSVLLFAFWRVQVVDSTADSLVAYANRGSGRNDDGSASVPDTRLDTLDRLSFIDRR